MKNDVNLVVNNIVYLPKLIFFIFIYCLITKESFLTLIILLSVVLITNIFLFKFRYQQDIGIQLGAFSFLLILPLSLNIEKLPFGYQYISISIIGSLLYLKLDKSRISDLNFFKGFIYLLKSALVPFTYLSGPSATIKELTENKNNFQFFPKFTSIKKDQILHALSGFFRVSLGYYLLSKSDQIDSLNPFINYNFNFIFSFLIFGFYYFWKYYLLFSGASDLCKASLSTIGINVIDNFKNPEVSVFYHDIWGTWHLNITDRVRKYFYTPITLFALRKSSSLNKFFKFLIVEGLPVGVLFFILSIWHGGRPKDILFGFISTILVLSSRYLGKNKELIAILNRNNLFLELFRILNLIIFGSVLSIYEMPFVKDTQNSQILSLDILLVLFILVLINLYFRYKRFILKNTLLNSNNDLRKIYFGIFEFITSIIVQLYFIDDISTGSDF